MLVRPSGERGFEVFMLRRSSASAFAPDAYVFPGGTIDPQDEQPQARKTTYGVNDDWLRNQFRSDEWASFPSGTQSVTLDEAQSLVRAALRELFEESGVLLGCDENGATVTPALLPDERTAVQSNTLSFAALLERHHVFADARALTLFSQWITPATEPRRYNTHFFIARGSEFHTPLADAIETHDGIWIDPHEALDRSRGGVLYLVYPTIKHLERLAEFDYLDELFVFARNKPIYRIMPEDRDADHRFTIPAELERAW